MSERRRHLLVLLIVLGLIAGSLIVAFIPGTKKDTKLGLDLQGGVQLIYQGKPTKDTPVNAESLDRALDIMRDRVDAFGVAEPELARTGEDQIDVSLPGRRGRRPRRRSDRVDRPALLLRLGEERPRRELRHQRDRDQRRPAARHRPLQRGQARRRSATSRSPANSQAAAASRFYAFDKVSKKPFNNGIPDESRKAALDGLDDAPAREGRGHRGQARRARPARREAVGRRARSRRVLDHPRRPGPLRHRHQEPGAELRPAGRQRADRHVRVLRQGPARVPVDHERGRPARRRQRQPAATPTPTRARTTSRSRSTTSSSRSRSSTTARTPTASTARPAPRSPAASRSRAPRTSRRSSRPARCRCGSS